MLLLGQEARHLPRGVEGLLTGARAGATRGTSAVRAPASHTGGPGLSAHSLHGNTQPSKAVSGEHCFLEM